MSPLKALSVIRGYPVWGALYDPNSQLPVHAAMLLTQLLSGGYYVITKVAFIGGMHPIVLSVYRDLVAIMVLIPAAYFTDRKNPFTLSPSIFFRLLLLGCTWIFGSQLLVFLGISYTSADFAAAMQPCIPVFTAMIAIAFGIEKVNWLRRDGQAKIAGIVICCTGAAVMALYRGPPILGLEPNVGVAPPSDSSTPSSLVRMLDLTSQGGDLARWRLGALCLIGNCLCMAVTINIQAPLLKELPCPLTVTAYSYVMGVVMIGVAGIFLVDQKGAWNLSWNANLIAVFYNGLIASAFNFGLMTWCLKRVGPLFVASYIPAQPIISAILSSIFLGSIIYFSSLLGTSLIIGGVFLVSWARVEALKHASLGRDLEATNLRLQKDDLNQSIYEPLIHSEGKS